MRLGLALLAWLAVASLVSPARAAYDCPRTTVMVPYPAGGAADVAARLIADRMEARIGRSFVVENRPGATGNVGTAAVVAAKPDGCTLLVNAAVIATFPSSFAKLGYDPLQDLIAVGGIGVTPTLLVAAKSVPADDVKGIVALSRQRAEGVNFSTAGYGLLQHLAVEEIAHRTGARLVHVIYKGGAQASTDLVAGRVELGSFAAGSVIQLVRSGQLKALGVVQEGRSALVPDVATTAEQGFTGLDAGVHFMLYAPAGTSREVVTALNGELNAIVADPTLRQRFADIGFDPTAISPDEAARIMRRTGEDWAPLIKRLNIKLD